MDSTVRTAYAVFEIWGGGVLRRRWLLLSQMGYPQLVDPMA